MVYTLDEPLGPQIVRQPDLAMWQDLGGTHNPSIYPPIFLEFFSCIFEVFLPRATPLLWVAAGKTLARL